MQDKPKSFEAIAQVTKGDGRAPQEKWLTVKTENRGAAIAAFKALGWNVRSLRFQPNYKG